MKGMIQMNASYTSGHFDGTDSMFVSILGRLYERDEYSIQVTR